MFVVRIYFLVVHRRAVETSSLLKCNTFIASAKVQQFGYRKDGFAEKIRSMSGNNEQNEKNKVIMLILNEQNEPYHLP